MSFLHKDSVLLFDHTFTYCKAFFHDLTLSNTLENREPVILCVMMNRSFFSLSTPYVIEDSDDEECAHAIIAVGTGEDLMGNLYILIRNSWGNRWGMQGYAWISEAFYLNRTILSIRLKRIK